MLKDILFTLSVFASVIGIVVIAFLLKYLFYLDIDLKTKSEVVQKFAVATGVVIGGIWAFYRFFIQRAYETALEIDLSVTYVQYINGRFLVLADAVLKNKGLTRISAKPKNYPKELAKPVYSDDAETLFHSGSLQLRRIKMDSVGNKVIDWFESDSLEKIEEFPDEINLLNEYEICKDGGVEFWIEPNEVYHCTIPVIIPKGYYLAKVSFIGNRGNFEFWSRIFQLNVGHESPKNKLEQSPN